MTNLYRVQKKIDLRCAPLKMTDFLLIHAIAVVVAQLPLLFSVLTF